VGKSSRTVCHRSWAGPVFQSCPRASGAVQRLGYSRGGTALILRPSAFQAGHIPSWRESYESYALPPVADDGGWLLLLLSRLLSADAPVPIATVSRLMAGRRPGPRRHLLACFRQPWPRPVLSQAPLPNPIAAEPYGSRVLLGGGAFRTHGAGDDEHRQPGWWP